VWQTVPGLYRSHQEYECSQVEVIGADVSENHPLGRMNFIYPDCAQMPDNYFVQVFGITSLQFWQHVARAVDDPQKSPSRDAPPSHLGCHLISYMDTLSVILKKSQEVCVPLLLQVLQ